MRFRKSFKIAPGVKINVSGSGLGLTLGGKGLSASVGSRGTYLNTSLPGTGLSERIKLDGGGEKGAGRESVAHDVPRWTPETGGFSPPNFKRPSQGRDILRSIKVFLLRFFGGSLLVSSGIFFLISFIGAFASATGKGALLFASVFFAAVCAAGFFMLRHAKKIKESGTVRNSAHSEEGMRSAKGHWEEENDSHAPAQARSEASSLAEQAISGTPAEAPAAAPSSPADILHITYEDANGFKSERDIEILNFEEYSGLLYINAFCHLRKEQRQFLADRVLSVETADCPHPDPQKFFWRRYHQTPEYQTEKALSAHYDEILLLVFMARSDGKMMKNEREIVLRYIDAATGGIDAGAAEALLKRTACELAQFNGVLKKAKGWTEETKKLLLSCAGQIYNLKKSPDPMETAAMEKLSKALSA
ncbi:MAG: hypothetical protein MdMp014T_0304 [Treponematales bacterium]